MLHLKAMEENTPSAYNSNVDAIRETEYSMLKDAIYLDYAGTTLYSKSLMEQFAADMMSSLYGNPHSASASSSLSTTRIENVRLRVLRFFNADPEHFDLVFVANATAGIKLVGDAFSASVGGFKYRYHEASHTSLVGVRELAVQSSCLNDEEVEDWLSSSDGMNDSADVKDQPVELFAYPAQSNMNGRRQPLTWIERLRQRAAVAKRSMYSLLDVASLVSTSPLDLSDPSKAADFTVLSFYKIFGFPDLGAVIVRKDSGQILRSRKFFGGGTVELLIVVKEQWHALKDHSLHDSLEDGTLPFHSIMALDSALDVQQRLYGSMKNVSDHTYFLAKKLYHALRSLQHWNGTAVCNMYAEEGAFCDGSHQRGPIVTFNIRNADGAWISNAEVERLANIRKIHIRTGGVCNPGGIATSLELDSWEMKRNFSSGFRCGAENDIMGGKPTGIIRASFGAMSNLRDVDAMISFMDEFFVEKQPACRGDTASVSDLYVESLTIYPIKSCGGSPIPPGTDWEVRPEGLAWDREWCLVHHGTGKALSQKAIPRMALIKPAIDLVSGVIRISYQANPDATKEEIKVPLSNNPGLFEPVDGLKSASTVCGDTIRALRYRSDKINGFFTRILGLPCALARFPAGGSGPSIRHAKAYQQHGKKDKGVCSPEELAGPPTPPDSDNEVAVRRPILLSNESPILAINRASLDALNKEIFGKGGKAAAAAVFRANIVIASQSSSEEPYCEDRWSSIRIGQQDFQMLGPCRRCHMICVDQDTAVKNEEPFVTLAKTRRFEGKVFFGSHMCHIPGRLPTREKQYPTIRVGDAVAVIRS